MSMRGAVSGCVVLMCLVVLLVEKTDGHITFFSPKEMLQMKYAVTEGKKDMEPRSEDGHFEEVTVQELPEAEQVGNNEKTVEIAIRLTPTQLDHVTPVLEEIIHEIVEEHQKGTFLLGLILCFLFSIAK